MINAHLLMQILISFSSLYLINLYTIWNSSYLLDIWISIINYNINKIVQTGRKRRREKLRIVATFHRIVLFLLSVGYAVSPSTNMAGPILLYPAFRHFRGFPRLWKYHWNPTTLSVASFASLYTQWGRTVHAITTLISLCRPELFLPRPQRESAYAVDQSAIRDLQFTCA